MDIISLGNSYLENAISQNQFEREQTRGTDAKNAASNLSSESTREELTEAAKSFESYFVEQILKEVKDSADIFGDMDSTNSMTADFYLDSTIQTLARQLVDEYGDSFTEDLVDQMARNYGVPAEEDGK